MEPPQHPDYKPGMVVSYADAGEVMSDDVPGVVTGTVNGSPVCADDGTVLYVPVWTERDNGREATTIYVKIENLLGEVPSGNHR